MEMRISLPMESFPMKTKMSFSFERFLIEMKKFSYEVFPYGNENESPYREFPYGNDN